MHVSVLLSGSGPGGPLRVWHRRGRPAVVNCRFVYRWSVSWWIAPLPLSATYMGKSGVDRRGPASLEMVVSPHEK